MPNEKQSELILLRLAADAPKYYLQSSFEKDATQMVTSKLRESTLPLSS